MEFSFKPTDNRPALEQFGRNLNQEVMERKIDPVIGRDQEIRRLIEILSRKQKNNPILIGEPGVGKTAVVEGFVQRIVAKDVPINLLDKEVYEISLSNIISGAGIQGEFEARIQKIIKQVQESGNKIILFIDEIHQLVSTGKNSASTNVTDILKPLMARGDFKIIGATTLDEYRNYIEKDGALERRFQKIIINEPTKSETCLIMRGLKPGWELFHGVEILDSAIVAAVDLADRYITDRNLPDKAIDLIDEAAARIKTEMHSQPKVLDQLNRDIIHLATEKAALGQEKNEKNAKKLVQVEIKLNQLKRQQQKIQNQWDIEKQQHKKFQEIKVEIQKNQQNIEKNQNEGNFEEASKLLYLVLPRLQQQGKELEQQLTSTKSLVQNKVTAEGVAGIIADSMKIPLQKIVESEKEKLLRLKELMMKKIIGQNQAIELINSAVLRNRVGINDPNKPIGSFLFAGPTGVGKTEIAKVLSLGLFNDEKALIRLDMSEFMEKHTVSKLIGSPPGYVGYDQGGILTEAIRQKPYAVVLFDEIEKAHPDVLNLLLQILDYGKLVDGQGRNINFKNTIIIMSTNVGSDSILEDSKREDVIIEIKKKFKPELLNRMDEIVCFNRLSQKTVLAITNKFLSELAYRLNELDYQIHFDHNVSQQIVQQSYDRHYGARPLKRFIQNQIENLLSAKIINNAITVKQDFTVSWDRLERQFLLKPGLPTNQGKS